MSAMRLLDAAPSLRRLIVEAFLLAAANALAESTVEAFVEKMKKRDTGAAG